MAKGAELIVSIITDASKAGAGIDEAESKFGKFNSTMGKLVGPATAVLGGITALGVASLGAASDLQQAAGGVEAVFGSSAGQIEKWAASASSSVGLSSAAYQTFAAQIGAQLKNLGVPMDQVAGQTDELIRLGADLAATYGGTTEEAVSALGAAFRGEADPAERYGLALNQTAVNAELAARGLTGLEGEALTAAKAQIIMEKATEQAGGAVGQFARESDTVAGSQQRLNASVQDTAAALGEALLPVIQPIIAALADFAKWVQQNASWIGPLVAIIGALAAAVIAYTAVQWALNVAMTANPIGLIIVAVAALVAAFIWLWNNVEGFRNFFIGLWDGIVAVVTAVVDWFVAAWNATMQAFATGWEQIASFFTGLWNGIQSVVGAVAQWFSDAWNAAINFIVGYFQFWFNIVMNVINAIRGVIGTVANWFSDVWNNAVAAVVTIILNLRSVFTSVFNAIMVPIRAVIGFFNDIVGAIQNVISWLGRIKIPDIFGAIGNFFGGGGGARSAAPAGFAALSAAPPVVSGRALAFSGAGLLSSPVGTGVPAGGVVINVNGGIETSDTIARTIEGLLAARARRTGGVTISRGRR